MTASTSNLAVANPPSQRRRSATPAILASNQNSRSKTEVLGRDRRGIRMSEDSGMAIFWAAVAAIAAILAIVSGIYGAVVGRRADRRSMRLEHAQLQPQLDFRVVGVLGGGGYELRMVVDRPVDSVVVSIVRSFDQLADDTVMGVTAGAAPGPAGTMTIQAKMPAVPAGAASQMSLWTSDHERAEGAQVKLSCQIRHGSMVWENVLATVTLPRWSMT